MVRTTIKNNEVYMDDIPYSKWTSKEFRIWKAQTQELIVLNQNMLEKYLMFAISRGHLKND